MPGVKPGFEVVRGILSLDALRSFLRNNEMPKTAKIVLNREFYFVAQEGYIVQAWVIGQSAVDCILAQNQGPAECTVAWFNNEGLPLNPTLGRLYTPVSIELLRRG